MKNCKQFLRRIQGEIPARINGRTNKDIHKKWFGRVFGRFLGGIGFLDELLVRFFGGILRGTSGALEYVS